MGSGKTATGKPLAKNLGYGFVDSDNVIEQLARKTTNQIFLDHGEKYFRELESKVLQEIGTHYGLVVATGGGVVTKTKNWGVLHQGVVIWIDPGRETLLARLDSDQTIRPLLQTNNQSSSFDRIIKERYCFYQEADLRISVENNQSPEEVAVLIEEELPSIIHSQKGQGERHTTEH
tara:strand:- start:3218 stop:3745 length:528 start_codon:yes stop_codon:yes gene_type:complete